ncbi:MAG: response regulator [Proteobacteria bacterium]|nr:response regulator [Pseudomonadota bacterium]
MKKRVLIVEDEENLAKLMQDYLHIENIHTDIIADGTEVKSFLKTHTVDVMLLDLMLPGKDGISICKETRTYSQVPIIITTARVEEIDRIIGLEIGADDYVCKPYSPRELVARVKVQLRKSENQTFPEGLILNEDFTLAKGLRRVELTFVESEVWLTE